MGAACAAPATLPAAATPSRAIPNRAIPGHATTSRPILGRAIPGHAIPSCAIPGCATSSRAIHVHATPSCGIPNCAIPGRATPGHAMPGARDTQQRVPVSPGRDTPGPRGSALGYSVSGSSPAPLRLRQPLLQPHSPRWCLASLLDGFGPQRRLCGHLSPRRHGHLCCKPREGEGAELIPSRKGKGEKDNIGLVR